MDHIASILAQLAMLAITAKPGRPSAGISIPAYELIPLDRLVARSISGRTNANHRIETAINELITGYNRLKPVGPPPLRRSNITTKLSGIAKICSEILANADIHCSRKLQLTRKENTATHKPKWISVPTMINGAAFSLIIEF